MNGNRGFDVVTKGTCVISGVVPVGIGYVQPAHGTSRILIGFHTMRTMCGKVMLVKDKHLFVYNAEVKYRKCNVFGFIYEPNTHAY